MKLSKKRGATEIQFKGAAANRIFAQIAADLGGTDATRNMIPGTELHRMTTEEVAKKKNARPTFPPDLLGVVEEKTNNFICVDCISDDEDVDDDGEFTAILEGDAWFKGDTCVRCKELKERSP